MSPTVIHKSLLWKMLGLMAIVSLFVICVLPDNLIQTAFINDDPDSASLGNIVTSASLNKYPRNKDNAMDWNAMILFLASASFFSLRILSRQLTVGIPGTLQNVYFYRRNRSPPLEFFVARRAKMTFI